MKKSKPQIFLSLIIICFIFLSNHSQSQISGTYTIGGAGFDYEDFADAISAMENEGIGGDVQFIVEPGEYFNVSFIELENDGNYQIQFNYNGTLNDSASLIGRLMVFKTDNISFKGFTIFPMESQEISCIWIAKSRYFSLDSCKVLNLYNNQFDDDEGLILLEFPWNGTYYYAEINKCIINSEEKTILLNGAKGKVWFRDNQITGVIKNMFENIRAEYENNIFYITDSDFYQGWQTFNMNTFYYESIFPLEVSGEFYRNTFHCHVLISSTSVKQNIFHKDVETRWMDNANFVSNVVYGKFETLYCHGIKIRSNKLFGNCLFNNSYTVFGNNFVFDTVTFSHGAGQLICNNNFSKVAYLKLLFTSGIIENNNINSMYVGQISLHSVENNNFINNENGIVNFYGDNAHFYNPLYLGEEDLHSNNPLLIAKGPNYINWFNYDIDSVLRKNPCTIGANEICFNWEVDEVNLDCSDSLCLDLCIDSLENMYWSPGFLFLDSTATRPMIFPEDSISVYLNFADGTIYDSLIVNTEKSNPIALATYFSDGLTVHFENKSRCADTYYWDFGDGEFSEEESPVHEYEGYGSYPCEITVSNDLGSSNFTFTIDIITNLENQTQPDPIIIYPNPTNKIIRIDSKIIIENISLTDMNGQLLFYKEVDNENDHQLNLESLNDGVYFIRITTNQGLSIKKIIKIE